MLSTSSMVLLRQTVYRIGGEKRAKGGKIAHLEEHAGVARVGNKWGRGGGWRGDGGRPGVTQVGGSVRAVGVEVRVRL
jgi:hypothetical protein